jgi:hypothetical protein
MIRAEYHGSRTVRVPSLNIIVEHRTPVLALARKLVELGHGDDSLIIFRGDTPALNVPSIKSAAALTIRENASDGPHLAAFDPWEGLNRCDG